MALLVPALQLHVIDSAPVPICRFACATCCRRLRDVAAYGDAAVARRTFYGVRAHLRVVWPGVITGLGLAPGNVSDLAMAPEVLADVRGWALGDRVYWSPALLRDDLGAGALALPAPFRTTARETHRWPWWLVRARRCVKTVLGQLVERFHLARVWVRDRWHLSARVLRKVLSHTVAVLFCVAAGLDPLTFDALVEG